MIAEEIPWDSERKMNIFGKYSNNSLVIFIKNTKQVGNALKANEIFLAK